MKLGAGAAALLALAGGGVALVQPGLLGGRLTAAGRDVFEAVARAVLHGTLPSTQPEAKTALTAHMGRLDDVLRAFPPHVQAELSQLLSLLSTTPGRRLLAGLSADWPDASVEALQASLDDMRRSGIAVRQQAYHALRDITNAAFYSDASAWPKLGYPGPRAL
ncbi:hypothetical protein [Piscinibacter sp. HJYY11]|uniref:hypothetical protein n=1 Tax=Piscinibacter sp. HJYY11 TaxID=2801333 RepID=UPI001F462BE3|nr:hypothetical protein [Piscinibacter sp. HJYY11]